MPSLIDSYAHVLAVNKMVYQGQIPPGFKSDGECQNCGPMLLPYQTSGELQACPWCHSLAGVLRGYMNRLGRSTACRLRGHLPLLKSFCGCRLQYSYKILVTFFFCKTYGSVLFLSAIVCLFSDICSQA